MGCLWPRKLQYIPPIPLELKQNLPIEPITERKLVIDPPPNRILQPIQFNQNVHPHLIFTEKFQQSSPTKQYQNRSSVKSRESVGLVKQQILVSQIGGSKLQRSISILSTEADIRTLQSSLSVNSSRTQDMVVVACVFDAKDKLRKIKRKYYSLIQTKLYVKKDPRNQIKIKSLCQESNLFCTRQTVKETIHLTDGVPIENIKIVSTEPLTYLVEDNLPLSINLKLQCVVCKAMKLKMSSSCKLVLDFTCKCSSKQFIIKSVGSQPFCFPIWYQGKKITSGNIPYVSGSELRVVGCNICWKFEESQLMECGCLRCANCKGEHSSTDCILCL